MLNSIKKKLLLGEIGFWQIYLKFVGFFVLSGAGDGSHETDFDINAGPSNPEESTDQVPQGKLTFRSARKKSQIVPRVPNPRSGNLVKICV